MEIHSDRLLKSSSEQQACFAMLIEVFNILNKRIKYGLSVILIVD